MSLNRRDATHMPPAEQAMMVDLHVRFPGAGAQFLQYYGLPQHGLSKWEYLGVELLFFIMFFLLAWYMLAFKKHGKR